MKNTIAVIGAGVAGLACARRLVDRGHEVTVFERAGAAGGRIATMRTEIGSFDHGAQYFTARDAAFVAEAKRWSAAGIVEPWPVAVKSLGAASGKPGWGAHAGAGTSRWVGVPGMSAIASHLASGLDVRFDARIVQLDPVAASRIEQHGEQRGDSPRWSLSRREGDAGADAAVTLTEGLFDGVVVAIPAESAAALLNVAPKLARQASGARIETCWALLLGFTEPSESDAESGPTTDAVAHPIHVGDAAFVESGRLAWIARESSKPARRLGERWTAHAQSAWSVEHFDDDPEDVKAKLLRAFHEATGTAEQPIYAAVHRWRHALVRTPLACDSLWDAQLRVGTCGDWCRGHRVEDAWLSGVALADAIAGAD